MRCVWTAVLCVAVVLAGGGCGGSKAPADRSWPALTGTVRYVHRIALPEDAEVLLMLDDITQRDGPLIVVASRTIPTLGRQVPIPFELPYDPKRIDPIGRYAIRAQIRAGGEVRFITETSTPVLTMGAPSIVDLTLVPIGG